MRTSLANEFFMAGRLTHSSGAVMRHVLLTLAVTALGCATLTPRERVRVLDHPPVDCFEHGPLTAIEDCHLGRFGEVTTDAVSTCRHWAMLSLRDQAVEWRADSLVVRANSIENGLLRITAEAYECFPTEPAPVEVSAKPVKERPSRPGRHSRRLVRFRRAGSSETTTAEMIRLTPDSLTFQPPYGEGPDAVRIPVRDVESLELSRSVRRPGLGAIAGALGGAVSGVGIGGISTRTADAQALALGGLVGALVGAGVGALFGLTGVDTWVPAEMP